MIKNLRTFPAGSSGGPDGIIPQHLLDLLTSSDDTLKTALTDFINVMLSGNLLQPIREVILEGHLIALKRNDCGIRPIAIGYTLRRLAAKCANSHAITARSKVLKPVKVGVSISGGAEAAVHAVRRFVETIEDDNVLVKLEFANAFNTIRRDSILETKAEKTPELYKFVLTTHS